MESTRNRLELTARRAAAAADQGHRGRGVRAVPADQVPGRQALLAGGRRERHPAARPDHRALVARRRHPDRHRHGPPGPPQRAGQRAGQAAGRDLRRVPRPRHRPARRPGRRREVPPGLLERPGRPPARPGAHLADLQPQPPRVGQHRGAGARARQAGPHRRPRPHPRPAHPDPRRRRLRRPGRGGRGPQHVGARRLQRGRHHPHRRQQPDRLHHQPARRLLHHLPDRRRPHAADPDHPRQRRGPGGGGPGRRPGGRLPPDASTATSSSTCGATASWGTTRPTSPASPSRSCTRPSPGGRRPAWPTWSTSPRRPGAHGEAPITAAEAEAIAASSSARRWSRR